MAHLIEVDPRELLAHPSNPRTEFGDLDELVATIADPNGVGILQPVVLTPVDDGYCIIAGHRRTAAAIEAGVERMLCVVREDLAERTPEQVAAMLIENVQRKNLTTTEEALGYAQLTAFDWTPEQIARATGRKTDHVRNALTLAGLPGEVHKAADSGDLTLEDAAALEEFADDPKTVASILQKGSKWGVRHAVQDERRKRDNKAKEAKLRDELAQAGVVVIRKPKNFPWSSREAAAYNLFDAEGQRLDPEAVKTLPGFAAFIENDFGGPKTTVVCINPEASGYSRHGYNSYLSPEDAARKEAARLAEEEQRAALETAADVRRAFLVTTYGSAKAAKTLYLDALRDTVLDPSSVAVDERRAALVHDLAGVDLDTAENAGQDRLARLLVARWITAQENNLVNIGAGRLWGTRPAAALAWLDRLTTAGYEKSDAESLLHERLAADPGEQHHDGYDDEDEGWYEGGDEFADDDSDLPGDEEEGTTAEPGDTEPAE